MHPFSASHLHLREQAAPQGAGFPDIAEFYGLSLPSATGLCFTSMPAAGPPPHTDLLPQTHLLPKTRPPSSLPSSQQPLVKPDTPQPTPAVKAQEPTSSSRSSSSGASGSGQHPKPPPNPLGPTTTSKKERTRMIHKRFRERKKERMNNMQQELDKIQSHLQTLADTNETLQAKSKVLNGLLQCVEEQSAFVELYKKATQPTPPPELQALADLIARSMDMTNEDHIEGRRKYVATVLPLLAEAERDPDGPAMARIVEANEQQKEFCRVLCSLDPEPAHINAAFLHAVGLDNCSAVDVQLMYDPDASDHMQWGQVVAIMNLTKEQVRMALVMQELMTSNLQKLNTEQQALAAIHDRLIATTAAKKTTTTTRSSGSDLLLDPDDTAVALQLQRNMQRQKQTHIIMFWYLSCYVLDELQYAKLWVHCFPSIPFALNLLNVIATEQAAGHL